MTRPRVCPYCRAGIFDAIKQAGDIGMMSAEIIHSPLYRDRARVSESAIKAHIWQINELLEATAFSITSDRRRWYLRRRMRRVP